MKPLWINRIGTINTGILKGASGRVVGFDSIEDEATLALDEITFITISSDYIDQPDTP